MSQASNQRIVLLNRLVARSISRAPNHAKPPILAGSSLFGLLKERQAANSAIEFFGTSDIERDVDETDDERKARCAGLNFIWLRDIKIQDRDGHRFAQLLFEYVDQKKTSFSVVDTTKLTGRDISGHEHERGCVSAHVVVRLPIEAQDSGEYRCIIEVAPSINRSMIENFLCRQLRRWSHEEEATFDVAVPDPRKGNVWKPYRYSPRLELHTDVGRKVGMATGVGSEIAYLTFIKRAEKQTIGGKTHIVQNEFDAQVQLKVSAKQGPADPNQRFKWMNDLRTYYQERGYRTKLSFRHVNGAMITGVVPEALAGASDLMLCSKDIIVIKDSRDWYASLNRDVVEQAIPLLNKDSLWEGQS